MIWRLTIPSWEGEVEAQTKVETQAKLKVEAQVTDNDMATANFLVG